VLAIDDLERLGYHTVAIATPDTQGRPVGRTLPLRRFLEQPDAGVDISSYALVYDLAGIPLEDSPFAGAHTGYHDIRLRPDLATLRPYPGIAGVAICIADVVDADGREIPIAPRTMLRRQVVLAMQQGYEPRLATELEFYLFADHLRDARQRGFHNLEPTTPARSTYGIAAAIAQHPFLLAVSDAMTSAGIPVGSAQTEAGRGQWEVNLPPTDPLAAADQHLIFKLGVKELAQRAGHSVSFMARPVPTDLGSSCHIHCSLFDCGEPIFPAQPGSGALAAIGRHFLGGLLAHLADTAIFFAPNVNSYKRHAPGFAAGGVVAWGMDNRSVAVRVAGHGETLRLEHRYPGADANPYLAAMAILAAGLAGIAAARDPGLPTEGDADARRDLSRTPSCLGDALSAFECSTFAHESFGNDTVAHYAAHARAEWMAFLGAVTDWEIARAFEAV
jgi:glutamine synthetase